ncbi:MAG: alanine--tRNA ligase, partial [Clostridia bacterium]|nr:alanine--tRNA ligase [Clostridia bacterium]
WEFMTSPEWAGLEADRLYPSIYENDDEAFDIWNKEIGIPADHIYRFGKADNFWEHGSGPCGPCSEIYFDRGEARGCGSPDCKPGCDCDRFMEIWNNVFSQFNNDGAGNYTELQQKNIDTGMGLERLACVMQGVDNLFLVDTVQNIMKRVSELTGVAYGTSEKTDISLRVITDHIRSTSFMIADGVMPSNEGRGYVLRRLLRRAARHGRLLGVHKLFLADLVDTVVRENQPAYPELLEKRDYIKKLITVEEENFNRTIDQGLSLLNELIENAQGSVLSGDDAFKLNDTYGFPLDLTREILAEKNMTVDEERFHVCMKEQKERARGARKKSDTDAWVGEGSVMDELEATVFEGYDKTACEAVVKMIVENGEAVSVARAGAEVQIVLDRTPFYAESGGQVGDTGVLTADGVKVIVKDTTKNGVGVFAHRCVIAEGQLDAEQTVTATVDKVRRAAIMRNHTAAHLLQAALRRVLGTHVEQAGQLVNGDRLRFDFTHFSPMTTAELKQVELLVNEAVLDGQAVTMQEMPIDEAKKLGAMALFGEKYGAVVRVVTAGDMSVELCGGTHVNNTAKLGLFKICSESSVAAGVRRIEAVTGTGVSAMLEHALAQLNETAAALKVNNVADLTNRAVQLTAELKAKDKENEALKQKLAASKLDELMANAKQVGAVRVLTVKLDGAAADEVRSMCDQVKDRADDVVAVVAGTGGTKAVIAASVGKKAQAAGAHAGNIVRATAKLAGGNGGGRPDSATAGAKDISKIDGALAQVESIVAGMLK